MAVTVGLEVLVRSGGKKAKLLQGQKNAHGRKEETHYTGCGSFFLSGLWIKIQLQLALEEASHHIVATSMHWDVRSVAGLWGGE